MENITKDLWSKDLKVLYRSNLKSFKEYKRHLNPNWLSIVLVVSGTVNFIQGSSMISLSTGQIFFVKSGVEVTAMSSSPRICLLSCTKDFAFSNRVARFGNSSLESLFTRLPYILSLNKAELKYMLLLFKMLKKKLKGEQKFLKIEIIMLYVSLLFYSYGELCYKYDKNISQIYGRSEKIVMDFILLIEHYSREHHDVKFYADSLYITEGHLRKCVRSVLGHTAKHFIEMAILSEAYLLLANVDLSITEISEYLNFSSSQSFSGFFKKHTKFSPSQYRLSLIC